MGERANIVCLQNGGEGAPLYLYTHWGGHDLPVLLQRALEAGRKRWGDEQYLTRILFSHLVGDRWAEETGFGLTTYLCDNSYPLLVVDASCKRVAVAENPKALPKGLSDESVETFWTFDGFCALPFGDDPWEALLPKGAGW